MDTSFISYIKNFSNQIDSSCGCLLLNDMQHDLLQPLQAIYFSKGGDLVSYFTNCYTKFGLLLNLRWNINNNFDSFHPKTLTPIYDEIKIYDILPYIKDIDVIELESSYIMNKYDYVAVVFWNKFMWRHAKSLMKYVDKNSEGQNILILYVNNDNYFI